MEKELRKCRYNLEFAERKNAPTDHIENIKKKVGYYAEIIETIQSQDEMIRALINAQETLQKEIKELKKGHILYDGEV